MSVPVSAAASPPRLDGVAPHYYPVLLDLRDRLGTVVGGGAEAERRVLSLLEAGARVRVVASRLSQTLRVLADSDAFELRRRDFRSGDLEGSFVAFSERDAPGVEGVWAEAESLRIPVNVIDDPARCSFIAPSIVRRGDLVVAISTSGRAPALAVRLRQWLEGRLGRHYADFLEIAGGLREPLCEIEPDFARRRELWYRLVDSDVLDLLAEGRSGEARSRVTEITGVAPGGGE